MSPPYERSLPVLIKIEVASTTEGWVVWMDAWCVKFRSYVEAEAFMERLEGRINAPHPQPISFNRPVAESA